MIDFDLYLPENVCEPETAYRVNNELNLAWDIVENTGANLFLTGKAGTGKTTFLKNLREKSVKRMVVLAPTGVAAINARGNTIHSFFQLPFAPFVPGRGFLTADKKYLNVSKQKRRLISTLSLLVIDEISMVRPDTLDALDSLLRRLRSNDSPFGGVQLLLIGDLRQLPPVVKEEEWQLLKEHYATPYFFESHALKKAGFRSVELSVVYRQSDSRFLDILNSIRDGLADDGVLHTLNSRYSARLNHAETEGYIRLTTHNRTAAAINQTRLAALDTPEFTFEAETEGEFPESAYPVEKMLHLKRGAQVMFTKNDTGTIRRYYNGMLGMVSDLSEEKITVIPSDGGGKIEVEKAEWENTRYTADASTGTVMQERVGAFRQYPLQLAWAITIHKSQGLTFDKAIIDASHSFAPGQTYVALSRCRSLEGLLLENEISRSAVIIDRNVNEFVDRCENNVPDSDAISEMKEAYLFSLLSELFDFETLRRNYRDFYRYAMEFLVPLYPEIEDELKAFIDKIEKSLCDVSKRFLDSYVGKPIKTLLAASDSGLAERIKNGSRYFVDILEDLNYFLNGLPKEIGNQGYAERLNNSFDNLMFLLTIKRQQLHAHGNEEFSLQNYMDAKARAVLAVETDNTAKRRSRRKVRVNKESGGAVFLKAKAVKGADTEHEPTDTSKKKSEKDKKEKKPKGYSAFETLKMLREGKTVPEIASERGLKENTIGGHLGMLIQLGKLRIEDVADSITIETVTDVIRNNPEMEFGELLEKVWKRLEVPDYLVRLIRAGIMHS